MEQYYDKHGKEIKEGMTIRHDDGDLEKVYASDDDLGVSASSTEIYPLYQFNLKEWEIVEDK